MSSSWRYSREYRIWRVLVIRRDKVCQVCGTNQNRQAHHINHATYFIDLRFVVDNGITLCSKCHIQLHTNFKNSTREKCTSKDLYNFLDLTSHYKKVTEDNMKKTIIKFLELPEE